MVKKVLVCFISPAENQPDQAGPFEFIVVTARF